MPKAASESVGKINFLINGIRTPIGLYGGKDLVPFSYFAKDKFQLK